MQPRLTQTTKALVIEDWLRGLSRDRIADKHGLSTGTVPLSSNDVTSINQKISYLNLWQNGGWILPTESYSSKPGPGN